MLYATISVAETRRGKAAKPVAQTVELFSAIKAGDLDARFIPRDSRRATVWIENKTDKPLSIQIPVGFAGVPVAAQMIGGPGGGFPPLGGPVGGGSPQAVGAPGNAFPGPAFPPIGGPGGGPAGPPGFFSVPAGKTIKVKVPCVCLEHGKADPKPRIPYKIVPLESVTSEPRVAGVLASLGDGKYSQRVAQAAAWHLANGMTWEELDGKRIKHITGRQERWFHPAEIQAAVRLVKSLPADQPASEHRSPGDNSLSQR
jgi:hypothetical protein